MAIADWLASLEKAHHNAVLEPSRSLAPRWEVEVPPNGPKITPQWLKGFH